MLKHTVVVYPFLYLFSIPLYEYTIIKKNPNIVNQLQFKKFFFVWGDIFGLFSAIMNSAATNILIQVFLWTYVCTSVGYMEIFICICVCVCAHLGVGLHMFMFEKCCQFSKKIINWYLHQHYMKVWIILYACQLYLLISQLFGEK